MAQHRPKQPSDVERARAAAALTKSRTGGKPTIAEANALEKVKRWNQELAVREWLAGGCEQWRLRDWLGGVQPSKLRRWGDHFGAPTTGEFIDLPAFFSWFRGFLESKGQRLRALEGREESSAPLEKWQNERYLRERLRRLNDERAVLDRSHVEAGLSLIAERLRQCGDDMQRQLGKPGRDAYELLQAAIDDMEREVLEIFRDDTSDESEPGNAELGTASA